MWVYLSLLVFNLFIIKIGFVLVRITMDLLLGKLQEQCIED